MGTARRLAGASFTSGIGGAGGAIQNLVSANNRYGLYVSASAVTINVATLYNNRAAGIRQEGGTTGTWDSLFVQGNGSGIEFAGNLTVSNSVVAENIGNGIDAYTGSAVLNLQNAVVYGNATGIGNADFTTRRLVDKIDMKATLINCITACAPNGAKVPATFDTDQEAVETALSCIGLTPPEKARVIRIKNTLLLGEIQVSEAFLPEIAKRPDLTPLDDPRPLAFDVAGRLLPP